MSGPFPEYKFIQTAATLNQNDGDLGNNVKTGSLVM